MTYLTAYLAFGAFIAASYYIAQKISEHRTSLGISRALSAALFPERHTLRYRLVNHVVVPLIAVVVVAIAWPIALLMQARMWLGRDEGESVATDSDTDTESRILKEHLLERLSLDEVERRELVSDPLDAVPDAPFGHLHARWVEFRAALGPGDEVWSFSACGESGWNRTEERVGYVVVRPSGIGPSMLTAWKERG